MSYWVIREWRLGKMEVGRNEKVNEWLERKSENEFIDKMKDREKFQLIASELLGVSDIWSESHNVRIWVGPPLEE